MLKKIILPLVTTIIISLAFVHTSTLAAGTDCSKVPASEYSKCMSNKNNYSSAKSATPFKGSCRSGFLGLTSWDCGVTIQDEESLKNGIWQIVANVATDITIIAAYLVLGYVIYGGYLYIFSSGDPSKVAASKKTLTQAFIGLAIVMSAYAIMSAIRIALLGNDGKLADCVTSECVDANALVTNAIGWIIGMAGVVAVIFIVYGGISYITSSGDPTKLQKAKQVIIYALIGLAIVALAEAITAFVSNMIRNANNNAASIPYHQTLISTKESNENNIL